MVGLFYILLSRLTRVEILQKAEQDLDDANRDLNHGDSLLTKMKNPMLHPFSHDRTGASDDHQSGGLFHHHSHHQNPDTKSTETTTKSTKKRTSSPPDDMDELAMLSSALSELQAQEEEVGAAIDLSMDTIDRLDAKVSSTDERLKSQSGKAKQIITKGNLF